MKIQGITRYVVLFVWATVVSMHALAQLPAGKKLFLIDAVPILATPSEDDELAMDSVATMHSVTGMAHLYPNHLKDSDSVVYVYTKAYMRRSDSVKKIPSLGQLAMNSEGKWTYGGVVYSGPFIDYYLNGNKKQEGWLANGLQEGVLSLYFQNGKLAKTSTLVLGQLSGPTKLYTKKGVIISTRLFQPGAGEDSTYVSQHPNGRPTGERRPGKHNTPDTVISYSSTGMLIDRLLIKNGTQQYTRKQQKLILLITNIHQQLQQKRYKEALRLCADAILLDSNNATAYFLQGLALLNDHHILWAIQSFDQSLILEPLSRATLVYRAKAAIMAGAGANRINYSTAICNDLQLADELETAFPDGHNRFIRDAMNNHCPERQK